PLVNLHRMHAAPLGELGDGLLVTQSREGDLRLKSGSCLLRCCFIGGSLPRLWGRTYLTGWSEKRGPLQCLARSNFKNLRSRLLSIVLELPLSKPRELVGNLCPCIAFASPHVALDESPNFREVKRLHQDPMADEKETIVCYLAGQVLGTTHVE